LLVSRVSSHHRGLVVAAAHMRLGPATLVLTSHLAAHLAAHVGAAVLAWWPPLPHVGALTLVLVARTLVLVALLPEATLAERGVLSLIHFVLNG